ncbi:GNAT family N-acetyltransferase [Kordiimonas aestuarii]|uniref:GNAT family N-acetyltransferase n=1 Tax=Kordiimonas aestuarii TaxID=1005925 RepID=UPI0021D14043|nr:GNAT family N-acetyltransferase [Kordiimonas aestuarii]
MNKSPDKTVRPSAIIRAAKPSDASALRAYTRTIYAEGKYLITRPQEFRISLLRQRFWIARKSLNPDEACFVAEINGVVIASLECWTDRRRRVRHNTSFAMSVHPGHRTQGIGKKLLLHFIKWVQNHPRIERIELHVHADNAAAIALYRSLGFLLEGTRLGAVRYEDGRTVDDHIMALWPKTDMGAPDNGA